MYNVALANIDVAEIMSHEENHNAAEQLKAALESNPAVNQMMEAARNVEDMYLAVKDYIGMKLEDFKVAYDKSIDFLRSSKAKLEDGMMECVVGGVTGAAVWNGIKKAACAIAVVTGMAVLGAAAGGAIAVGIVLGAGLLPKISEGGSFDGTIEKVLGAIDAFNAARNTVRKYLPIPFL